MSVLQMSQVVLTGARQYISGSGTCGSVACVNRESAFMATAPVLEDRGASKATLTGSEVDMGGIGSWSVRSRVGAGKSGSR